METSKLKRNDILLMQGSALVFSLSNIFSKFAAKEKLLSPEFILLYIGSLSVMMIYAVLWQQILKRVSMVVAYSNRLIAMVWGVVWGRLIFGETIKLSTIIGTVVILTGLFIMVRADE